MATDAVTPVGSPGDWATTARPPRSQQRSPGLPPGWASGAGRGAGPDRGPEEQWRPSPYPPAWRAHAARAHPGPSDQASPCRASPRAHLTVPLGLRRSRTNRQKDSACCAPRDPRDAPSVSPAPHTNAPWPRPGDAVPPNGPALGPAPPDHPGDHSGGHAHCREARERWQHLQASLLTPPCPSPSHEAWSWSDNTLTL